jgi:hypothetical protein
MKTFVVAIAAAVVSAAASVSSLDAFQQPNERELSVELASSVDQEQSVIPFIEMAARESGLKGIRAYKNDVFVPLEQAQLSFGNVNGHLTMHVAVESEYRFKKTEREAALAGLRDRGQALYARALELQAQAH